MRAWLCANSVDLGPIEDGGYIVQKGVDTHFDLREWVLTNKKTSEV